MATGDMDARVTRLEDRMNQLETQFDGLSRRMQQDLDSFGDYKNRTKEELSDVCGQLTQIVGTLEAIVGAAENRADIQGAASLLKRARNHLTRANKSRIA
jgi:predicted  nucleic acid-binding Zn-ribbon protein